MALFVVIERFREASGLIGIFTSQANKNEAVRRVEAFWRREAPQEADEHVLEVYQLSGNFDEACIPEYESVGGDDEEYEEDDDDDDEDFEDEDDVDDIEEEEDD